MCLPSVYLMLPNVTVLKERKRSFRPPHTIVAYSVEPHTRVIIKSYLHVHIPEVGMVIMHVGPRVKYFVFLLLNLGIV